MSLVQAERRRPSPAQGVRAILIIGGLVAAVVIVRQLPAASSSSGRFETPPPVLVLGVIQGMTYGLLAMGLVLIYRTNRIINFAHGQIGVLAAALFALAATRWHVPYWVALPLALAIGAAVSAVAEAAAIRRLHAAPRLMSIVATLGIGQFVGLLAFSINGQAGAGALFPQPPGLPTFAIGELQITPAYSGMLFLSPLVALSLALFLRRSRYGLGIRAAAANPEGARLAGIFSTRMSSLTWGLAGALSAFTAILTQPTQGLTTADSFGPNLLLRALTAAALAGMTSMPRAMCAGVAVGVIEQTVFWNYPQSGLAEVTLFALTMVALLRQRIKTGRNEDKRSDWNAVRALRPLPDHLRGHWLVRRLGPFTALVCLVAAIALPAVVTTGAAATLTGIFAVAIVGLSIGLLTGLSGQLTLGHFAIAAAGATISYYVSRQTGNFPLAFLCAAVGAGIVSVILGLPALRSRGLMLTVTTLSFAIIVPVWLLRQPFALGEGIDPGRPVLFGRELGIGRGYYYFALAVLVVAFVAAANVRRSGFGRLLVAVRDNEDNARAFGVSAARIKWQSYLLAGGMAGVGGATYGHSLSSIGPGSFPARTSLDLVVMAVIGGVSLLAGPLLGALLVIGLPAFVPLDSAGLAATAFGQLVIILYLPRGLAQLVEPLRDLVVRRIAGRGRPEPEVVVRETRDVSKLPANPLPIGEGVLLEADNLTKRFGGVTAVDGVSFTIRAGETVGLIGANGAGKTTTFELLGGFTRPDSGAVYFADRDITRLRPEQRARRGLIRSFQDARLFPTMTVRDAVALSLERAAPTRPLRSVLGLPDRTRSKDRHVHELIGTMGLNAYQHKQIQELSTGTRRITELTCLIGLEPILLLLDEPSSGIAQRETEALGRLLRELATKLDITMVVIEHDIPLIMGLADRVIAMDTGQVIADGTPDAVRSDPRVIASYLGAGGHQLDERPLASGA